ncbi:MAG: heparan-alpha-glucosaminide N-acetyltransferase [Euryarchaeota archaeon]|nr:heparan-alpha-glucosaminide N-acetyltransferase [Euryarchaeota archaeon]
MDKHPEQRLWEIDFLRGLAIIMMVVFHLLYDLTYFGGCDLNIRSGFWLYFGRATATIFIFLVGVSLTLSFSRYGKIRNSGQKLYLKYLKRGLKIFSWGLIITLATWIFLREGFVLFGILHLIGISIILAYPFLKHRYLNLLLGIAIIPIGIYLKNFTFSFYWLVWLGFVPDHFCTVDYFPIVPWFGVILIGVFFGNLLYPNYTRKFNLWDCSEFRSIGLFCLLGRHSLAIYLIHQPILIILLYLLGIVDIVGVMGTNL